MLREAVEKQGHGLKKRWNDTALKTKEIGRKRTNMCDSERVKKKTGRERRKDNSETEKK